MMNFIPGKLYKFRLGSLPIHGHGVYRFHRLGAADRSIVKVPQEGILMFIESQVIEGKLNHIFLYEDVKVDIEVEWASDRFVRAQ